MADLTMTERIDWQHREDLRRLRGFRLLDDDFLTKCFEGDPKYIQLVLRIVLEMPDLVAAFEPQGVILRYRQQNQSGLYRLTCHILRLGNVAVATNPFELFHAFAQRIKARAEAEQVFIVQLSNGCGGYLPTEAAVRGGSYSSKPASTVCGPDGGEALVAKTLEVLEELWESGF